MAIAESVKAGIDKMLEQDLVDDPRVMHLPFRELAADPQGTVRRIDERAGLPVSEAFAGRVQAWLADPENAVDRYGRYPYSYEAFGIDKGWIRSAVRGLFEAVRLHEQFLSRLREGLGEGLLPDLAQQALPHPSRKREGRFANTA